MRSPKYLNAREYAERLYLSDNRDVQDFAREFIEALDFADELETAETKARDNMQAAETLQKIGDMISELCPAYDGMDIEEIIPDMLNRLRPVQEYDL
jgi:hypothetical protein